MAAESGTAEPGRAARAGGETGARAGGRTAGGSAREAELPAALGERRQLAEAHSGEAARLRAQLSATEGQQAAEVRKLRRRLTEADGRGGAAAADATALSDRLRASESALEAERRARQAAEQRTKVAEQLARVLSDTWACLLREAERALRAAAGGQTDDGCRVCEPGASSGSICLLFSLSALWHPLKVT